MIPKIPFSVPQDISFFPLFIRESDSYFSCYSELGKLKFLWHSSLALLNSKKRTLLSAFNVLDILSPLEKRKIKKAHRVKQWHVIGFFARSKACLAVTEQECEPSLKSRYPKPESGNSLETCTDVDFYSHGFHWRKSLPPPWINKKKKSVNSYKNLIQ